MDTDGGKRGMVHPKAKKPANDDEI